MRSGRLLGVLGLWATLGCQSSAYLVPIDIEDGGEGAFHRSMPKERAGCFWATVRNGPESFTDQLFLCCPDGAVVSDPSGGVSATQRPVCTKAVWGR